MSTQLWRQLIQKTRWAPQLKIRHVTPSPQLSKNSPVGDLRDDTNFVTNDFLVHSISRSLDGTFRCLDEVLKKALILQNS